MGICLKCNNSTCDLLCTKHPRVESVDSVSGETHYISNEDDMNCGSRCKNKYSACIAYNYNGECTDFELETFWHKIKMNFRWIPNSF